MAVDNEAGGSRFDGFRKAIKDNLKFSFVLYIGVHIAMIIIAAMNLSKCPVDSEIPIYLLSSGVVGIVSKILALLKNFIIKYIKISTILTVVVTIELLILILGSYHTFKEYKPSYDPASSNLYCNKTVYLTTFVIFIISWILFMILAVGICCFIVGLKVLDRYIDARIAKDLQKEEEKRQAEAAANASPI